MGTSETQAGSAGADRPERLRLKVTGGNAAGTMIEVKDELLIGRQATGAGTLANDMEISRRHARIVAGPDGRFLIEDLGSTNGTWVNGRRVESAIALEIGDHIEVGSSKLVVQIGSIAEATPTPGTEISEPAPSEPPPAEPAPPARPAGQISLRIEVDLDAMEAVVSLDEGADEVTLVHEDGRWRLK